MIEAEKTAFVAALTRVAAAYREECDLPLFDGYWMTLSDLPWPDVEAAIFTAMRTCKFMPKAAEIREFATTAIETARIEKQKQLQSIHSYCESRAMQIVREGRRAGLDEAAIRARLKERSVADFPLFWPGEEPWSPEAQRRAIEQRQERLSY